MKLNFKNFNIRGGFHLPPTLRLLTTTQCDVDLIGFYVGNAEIAGLDIDGRMCGQLTGLKLQNFIT